jgi:hypothetical protein
MSLKKERFIKGIILAPDTASLDNVEGEIKVDSANGRIRVTLKNTSDIGTLAAREVVTNSQTQTLTNKTINASNNSISNLTTTMLASGVLDTDLTSVAATDTTIPSAKATKAYVDLHINDTTAAHAASAISNAPSGNLAATNVQAALNELQSDIDTRATSTALSNHINNTTGAHAASAISNTPSGNLAATDVQAALNELQTDINGRVTNSAVSTDNAVAVFDGTTGLSIKNSVAILSTGGALSGLTGLSTSGTATFSGALATSSNTANTQTGSSVNITSATTSVTRLTGAGLVSIGGYAATTAGRRNVIINATGASITVLNEDTSITAANRIITGTDTPLVIPNLGSFELIYNATTQRHHVLNASSLTLSGIIASQSTFTIANNQSSATNITGLLFNPSLFRGIKIEYSIYRQTDTASSARAQMGQLRFVYNTQAGVWYMSDDYAGQNAGVEFSIDNATGQIQYTSTNISGTNYVGTLKYSLSKTFGV